jgi:hypothetical protein
MTLKEANDILDRIVKAAGQGHLMYPTARAILEAIEKARVDEREACAKVVDEASRQNANRPPGEQTLAASEIATRIRART